MAKLQAEKSTFSWSGRKRCYDNIVVEWLSAPSNTRMSIYVPIALAGKVKSVCPASYGGTAM